MRIDLNTFPYSRYGSYMALSCLKENYRELGNEPGLYLRTVHGSAKSPLVARLRLIRARGGEELSFSSKLSGTALELSTEGGKVQLVFADCDTLLIRAEKGIELELNFLTGTGPYDYIYTFERDGRAVYMANCYKNTNRYLVVPGTGQVRLEQEWEESSSLYSRLRFSGENGSSLWLREVETEWDGSIPEGDFESCRRKNEQAFERFRAAMPSIRRMYEQTAYMAAFLNWSAVVRADGRLKRDGMYMSKNWMCNVWSWDHCFNAIALSYGNPQAAWDQFMVMFDLQDPTGLLPDSTNDAIVIWNYCKPPIHGWALKKMREHMQLTAAQKAEAYDCLSRWTDWWLSCRDYDRDGLCEYNHGNDSGWDNSTAFCELPPIAVAELQAFLVLQMETLCELAQELARAQEAKEWNRKKEALLENMLAHIFREDLPVSIHSGDHTVIENQSLLPYVSIVLGKRLPEAVREKMIGQLKHSGFYTDYGFATERPQSPYYRSDGYWRGPIWAPSTMLILDGLAQCGEEELVREAAERFARMVAASGFAENFDALTGEGLRDRAYTWTSSVFLILTHEYVGDAGAQASSSLE